MWAVVMFGGTIVVMVVVAALLTRFGGRAPGTEPTESATHDGAKAVSHQTKLGRGGFGGG